MMLHSLRNWIDNQSARLALLSPIRGGVLIFSSVRLCLWQCPRWGVAGFFFIFPALLLRLHRIRVGRMLRLPPGCSALVNSLSAFTGLGLPFWWNRSFFMALPAVTLLPAGLAVFPMLAALVWFRLLVISPDLLCAPLGLFCAWYWHLGCVPTY